MAKKLSTMQLVSLIVLGVTTVLAIVCLFIPFIGWHVNDTVGMGISTGGTVGLFKLGDADNGWGVMTIVFAILAVIACVAGTVVVCLKTFAGMNINSLVLMIVAIATAVLGILTLIFAFIFCGQISGNNAYALAAYSPSVGAWLLTIGAIGNGVFAFLSK